MKRKCISLIAMIAMTISLSSCKQTVSVSGTSSNSSSSDSTSAISPSTPVSGVAGNGVIDQQKNFEIDFSEKSKQYRYTIRDNNNTVLDSKDALKFQPKISLTGQDILKVQTYSGTDTGSCSYFNVASGVQSEWFDVVSLAETDSLLAYIDSSKSELAVQKIFAPAEYCKLFPIDMTKSADEKFTAQFKDNGNTIEVIRQDGDGNPKMYTFTL